MSDITVTAASDIEVDREALDASIHQFAGQNGEYYAGVFHKIHEAGDPSYRQILPTLFKSLAGGRSPAAAITDGFKDVNYKALQTAFDLHLVKLRKQAKLAK